LEENGDEFLALNQALTRLAGELEALPQKPEEIFNFVRRAQELQVQLAFTLESTIATPCSGSNVEAAGEEPIRPSETATPRKPAGKMFSCKPLPSMLVPSCANAFGRNLRAQSLLPQRSRSEEDSNTSGSV